MLNGFYKLNRILYWFGKIECGFLLVDVYEIWLSYLVFGFVWIIMLGMS